MDVRPLPVERDGEATRLLARAFLDYPTWDAIAPRAAARREAMIRHYYGAELAVARRHGGTLLAAFDRDDLAGVALAFEPVPTRRRHYRGFGFGLVGELQLPRRVTAWRMLREPT